MNLYHGAALALVGFCLMLSPPTQAQPSTLAIPRRYFLFRT